MCHMMALVMSRIQELGVEIKHITRSCTGLCQPVYNGQANQEPSSWEVGSLNVDEGIRIINIFIHDH